MAKKKQLGLVKVTLNLTALPYERMKELYPQIGASAAIRRLVDAHVAGLEKKLAAQPKGTVADLEEI